VIAVGLITCCLGEALLQQSREPYEIFIPGMQKTDAPFRAKLLPFFAIFVDALVLQGASPEHLEGLREQCLKNRRMLSLNYDGTEPDKNYVSYPRNIGQTCSSHRPPRLTREPQKTGVNAELLVQLRERSLLSLERL
jgi:hypothetical protein